MSESRSSVRFERHSCAVPMTMLATITSANSASRSFAEHEGDRAKRGHDGVEPGEHVRPHDVAERARRTLVGAVDLAQSHPFGGLGTGQPVTPAGWSRRRVLVVLGTRSHCSTVVGHAPFRARSVTMKCRGAVDSTIARVSACRSARRMTQRRRATVAAVRAPWRCESPTARRRASDLPGARAGGLIYRPLPSAPLWSCS